MNSLLLLDKVSDIHKQQDIISTFHAYLTASHSLINTNVQAFFTHKVNKLQASKNILLDLLTKKSISQSTPLRMAFMKVTSHSQITQLLPQSSIDSIMPRTSMSGSLLQIEYPIDIFESSTFDLSIARLVPFRTNDGSWVSHLPSIARISSGNSYHFLLTSDFVHCHKTQHLSPALS